MATSNEKKGPFFDDDNGADVICLSSDTDDEESSPASGVKKGGGTAPGAAKVNGNRDMKGKTLLEMGFKVDRPSGRSSSPSMLNGHSRAGGSNDGTTTTTAEPKVELDNSDALNDSVITLDDDSDFEIEYSRNDTEGTGEGTQAVDDSDDDVQVIEDGSYPLRYNNYNIKKMSRFSQESGTAEVNLSLPGINLGLISAGNRKSSKKEPAAVAGDESSQDTLEMEEIDDVSNSPVLEAIQEVEEGEQPAVINGQVGRFVPPANENYVEESRKALQRFINEFCARKHHGVKKDRLEKVKKKLLDAYDNIKHFHRPIHMRLKEEIESATNIIRCTPDLHWKTVKNLLDLMEPAVVATLDDKSESERNRDREQKKLELRIKYEKELAKMQKKIRKLEETVVDWDDEDDHNSSYIVGDKYKSRLIQAYYTLCDLSNCNRFTGRPIQTKINLRKHNGSSNYDVINTEVEKFINKKGFMFAPDYTDILDIITKANHSHALGLSQDEISKLAQKMFENVMKIIKKRREKDFKISMLALLPKAGSSSALPPPESSDSPPPLSIVDDEEDMSDRLHDPADMDPELLAKLEENEKLKKSEAEVIERFIKLAEEKGLQAAAVDEENVNESPPPSDNEGEEEDEEEDEEDEENKVNNQHEHEELTEDEDEVPETVSSGWTATQADLEDEDDNSNEGKTTAESESDAPEDNATSSSKENEVISSALDVPVVEKAAPPTDSVTVAIVKSSEAMEVTETETPKEIVNNDDEIQPPPAKRMRSDENCNEDNSVAEAVVAPEDVLPAAVESTPVV